MAEYGWYGWVWLSMAVWVPMDVGVFWILSEKEEPMAVALQETRMSVAEKVFFLTGRSQTGLQVLWCERSSLDQSEVEDKIPR